MLLDNYYDTALLDFEKRLDLSLARRQLDVQEAMKVRHTLKHTKVIRLTIFNTYAHQTGTYHLDNKTQVHNNFATFIQYK